MVTTENLYTFYEDEKITGYRRTHFKIGAESFEVAKAAIVKLYKINDKEFLSGISKVSDYSEILVESIQEVSVSENNGNKTIELFTDEGESIWDNAQKEPESITLVGYVSYQISPMVVIGLFKSDNGYFARIGCAINLHELPSILRGDESHFQIKEAISIIDCCGAVLKRDLFILAAKEYQVVLQQFQSFPTESYKD